MTRHAFRRDLADVRGVSSRKPIVTPLHKICTNTRAFAPRALRPC